MDNQKIGKFISEKRKALGLTQQGLAEKLQITNKAVSKWETGEGMPDIQLIGSLARVLGTTVDEIINGEDNIKEEIVIPTTKTLNAKVKDIILGLLCVVFPIYNIALCVGNAFNSAFMDIYGENLLQKLPYILIPLLFGAYWVIITVIFMCRYLKLFDFSFKAEKSLTIVAFIAGLVMLFVQQMDYSPINYGLLSFSFALLLGTFHGYRVPHKIFYGLAILFTLVFGIIALVNEASIGHNDNVDAFQTYAFVRRFVIALLFYVFYGVLEKISSKYKVTEQ